MILKSHCIHGNVLINIFFPWKCVSFSPIIFFDALNELFLFLWTHLAHLINLTEYNVIYYLPAYTYLPALP